MNAPPLQKFVWEPLRAAGLQTYLIREDISHPEVSGPKFYRLLAHLAFLKASGITHVVTAGGMHSNHVHGVAVLAKHQGLKATAYIRGLAHLAPTPLLQACQAAGMELLPTSFSEFSQRKLGTMYPNIALPVGTSFVPMGAATPAGVAAMQAMANAWFATYPAPDWLALTAGTGTTLRGIWPALPLATRVFCAAPFKDATFLKEGLASADSSKLFLATLQNPSRFGKTKDEAQSVLATFQEDVPLWVDNLYMPNMLVSLKNAAEQSLFKSGQVLWLLHCGGAPTERIYP